MRLEKARFVLGQIAHGMIRQQKEITEAVDTVFSELDKRRWIPVTERLPMKTDEYLVCYNNGDVSTDWYGFTDDGLIDGFDEDIIAWMPLPEAYKGGDAE